MDNDLKEKLRYVNQLFRNQLVKQQQLNKKDKRLLIEKYIGKFIKDYKDFIFKKIFAIDGSFNSYGDNFPFTLQILKSGAYGSGNKKYQMNSVLNALMPEIKQKIDNIKIKENIDSDESAFEFMKKQEIAKLEILMGIEIIKKESPDVIMFDGGFMRYLKYCPEEFITYKELAYDKKIVTIGLIEDIGSFIISKVLAENNIDITPFEYDKQSLYGVLNINETLLLNKDLKFKNGIYTLFSRFSDDPNPIGIDIFDDNYDKLNDILSLIKYTTPSNGRGISILIDKVDEFVKVTRDEVEYLVNKYIDKDLLEMYFIAKRNKR